MKIVTTELSAREIEIVQLVARGFTNQEIGESLCISIHTVKNHMHKIFLKQKVRNRTELARMEYSVTDKPLIGKGRG